MPEIEQRTGAADSPAPAGGFSQWLASIPLTVRMIIYGIFFLGFTLGLLPYLASRIEYYWPVCRIEIGWFRLVGAVMFLFFLTVYLWGSYLLSKLGRGAYVEFDPPRQFVCVGPFRWCRNPIAGCVVGMILGEAIAFSSTGIMLLFLVALPLAHLQVVLIEEPLLHQRFGASYDEYRTRVSRWLPHRPRNEAAS